MKKTLLIISIASSLCTALYSTSAASSQTYDEILLIDEDENVSQPSENYMYHGMGAGATAGTLLAGPVGFVVGGLVGAIIGSNQAGSNQSIANQDDNTTTDTLENMPDIDISTGFSNQLAVTTYQQHEIADESEKITPGIQIANTGPINTVIENSIQPQQETLMNILVSDLSLDVFFRSGSTELENFYPTRLSAIADLINTMELLELHLDGYTDRRGNRQENLALANKRLDKVRTQLIDAGVDAGRIVTKAFGEARMKSDAGDLEAYTFDRRVVIRFERLKTQRQQNTDIANTNTAQIINMEMTLTSNKENSATQLSESNIHF